MTYMERFYSSVEPPFILASRAQLVFIKPYPLASLEGNGFGEYVVVEKRFQLAQLLIHSKIT